jgi:hypothetical protein
MGSLTLGICWFNKYKITSKTGRCVTQAYHFVEVVYLPQILKKSGTLFNTILQDKRYSRYQRSIIQKESF